MTDASDMPVTGYCDLEGTIPAKPGDRVAHIKTDVPDFIQSDPHRKRDYDANPARDALAAMERD